MAKFLFTIDKFLLVKLGYIDQRHFNWLLLIIFTNYDAFSFKIETSFLIFTYNII